MRRLKDFLMRWSIPSEDEAGDMRDALERERRLRESLTERQRRRILVQTEIRALRGQ